jgi:AcrR family transcriptional regulator
VAAGLTAVSERQDTQELILDAAEAVFANSGFDGATTRAIAEEAGVNPALIHYHFRSKERLFEAVFARRSEAINARRRR